MIRASDLVLLAVVSSSLGHALRPMAMFPGKSSSFFGERPKRGASVEGLTEAERLSVLARHNMHRGDVSPSASNMVQLQWDDEIATDAQDWADQCTMQHNTKEDRETNNWSWVGQNLASGYGYTMNDYVDFWVNEKADYTYSNNSCAPSKVCGHYTQVVWADTNFVGCGRATCGRYDYLVCHYGPGGNFNGGWPYESGLTCSQCPYGYLSGCSNNLCQMNTTTDSPTTHPSTTGKYTTDDVTTHQSTTRRYTTTDQSTTDGSTTHHSTTERDTTDDSTTHPSTIGRDTTTDDATTHPSTTADSTTYIPTSDEVQTTVEKTTSPLIPCGNDNCDPWTQRCDDSSTKCVCRFGLEPCPDPCFGRCDRSTQICVLTDQGFECQDKQSYQNEEIEGSHVTQSNIAKRDASIISERDNEVSPSIEENRKFVFALIGVCLGGMATSATLFILVTRSYRKGSRKRLVSFRDIVSNSK